MNPKTSQPHRDDHRDDHGGYLADSPEASPPNGKGAEAANELLDAPDEPLAEQPLAEVRRGGRYSANRSTGLRAHSHYTPNELEERAKNAWYWTQLEVDGFNTKSELVIAGMTLMCELLEEQYNDGQAFPPAPEQTRRGPSPPVPPDRARRCARTGVAAELLTKGPRLVAIQWLSQAPGRENPHRRSGGLNLKGKDPVPIPHRRCDTRGGV